MSARLEAVVLTRNEESNIGDCLRSLAWVDSRLVFDAFSTDRTPVLAAQLGARVVQNRFENWASQRNAALEAAEGQWVLFVDADERTPPALAEEVRGLLDSQLQPNMAGWWVPRHNYMLGHRMRGGGWYPDYQMRLLRRGRARYDPLRPVHELVMLDGDAGYLTNVLIHHNYTSVPQFVRKMRRYTALEAAILCEQGVHPRPWTYATMPLREFWRRFVRLQGFRDHVYGLLFCGLMAWYTLATYWQLGRGATTDGERSDRAGPALR